METGPEQKPQRYWITHLIQKYPEAEAAIIETDTGVIVRTHFADGRPVDHKIEFRYETDTLKSTFPAKKGGRVHLDLGDEAEIVLKYYPKVNSWEEIDIASALEQIRKERAQ